MKKITLLLLMMLTGTLVFAQTLPLDFEVVEDDTFAPFNGAQTSVVNDPTSDAPNFILELQGNGQPFDGAAITMATYIDLSDDATNTITFDFWSPVPDLRTHLIKLEGAINGPGAVELTFNSNAQGWQTISIDFGPNLADDYPKMSFFPDFNNSESGTYYFDDITGPNGIVIPIDPIPSVAAPVPTAPDDETYSIYNDTNGFTTIFPVIYSFGVLSGEPDLDPSDALNRALKFNFGAAGYGQGEGGPDDVSAYDFVSFDYWAGAGVVGFDFVMISNDGGITEHKYQISIQEPVVNETWVKVEIPMSFFTDLGFSETAFFQWKTSPLNDSVDNDGIVYLDNVLLTQNATLSNNQARLQVVHNSPDPTLEVVDVYLNGDLLIDDFAFRTATPFIDAPANSPITIDIAPGTSVDVSESIFNVSLTLVADETYIAVASGTSDASISVEVFAGAREAAAVAGNTDVLVHHGSPDAPTVDVVNQDGGGILVDDISYPEFQGYLELPTDNYLLDITTADGATKVAGYQAYLAELGLADAAVTVFASGFLNPAENQDGPAFGLWVSLASGGPLVELKDEDFVEFPAPYCGPLEFSTNVEPITNVEFAGFTNRSDAAVDGSPAHEDFTSVVGQVSAGESYDIILEANTNGNFDSRFAVFIDWNQNDVFDTDEVYEITTIITFSTGEDDQQAIQSIEVPVGAVVGQTRMRVKKIYGDVEYLDPCIGSFYGQTEDYTVNVAGTLSNSTYDSADFTYYPNPVKGILSISIASKVDNLKVYNMLGQLVVETAPKVSNPQLDMNGLQPGLYLVTLEVEGSLQTFSVVKQ